MKAGKIKDFIENCILVVIFLVLVQTFMEDLAVVLGWSWSLRCTLILSGFGFDLFFTVEFLVRYFASLKRGEGLRYMVYQRGWVDLIASMPLLIFSSGPAVLALSSGSAFVGAGGLLNILKVVKTVRIARILRLLRLLKVFKKIKFVNSAMAQRHMTRVITTVVSAFVLTMTAASFLMVLLPSNDAEEAFVTHHEGIIKTVNRLGAAEGAAAIGELDGFDSILILRSPEGTLYTRYDNDYYAAWFGPSDYGYVKSGDCELFYSLKPLYAGESKSNLLIFLSILCMLVVLMVSYSPHFAITVTDPVNIMLRGLSDGSYNLEVLVPEEYKDDDIYRLARQYNEEYLPLKARSNSGDTGGLALKMDDFDDLFG